MPSTPPPSPTPHRLHPREWLLTLTILLVLATLILIANIQARHFSAGSYRLPPPVAVAIDGLVGKPGVQQVALGTPLGEVLRKARPKRFADLRGVDWGARVVGPLEIHVPRLTHVTITVEGAVRQSGQSLSVPVGTRVCDLRLWIELAEDADAGFLRKRRLLDEGETVEIPKRLVRK